MMKYVLMMALLVIGFITVSISVLALYCYATNNPMLNDVKTIVTNVFHK